MKNLFVSFWCKNKEGVNSEGNICIPYDIKIHDSEDIVSLQEFIEMKHGINSVVINNLRRME